MKQGIPAIAAILILLFSACRQTPASGIVKHNDSTSVFGDSVPISNGLTGKVFLLPDTTRSLPDFDTLTPLPDAIYAGEINVPWQKWSAGFPGLRGRFEWFGIEYTGRFQPHLAGNYHFKLISDDGSKLFIDDKLFLDNDGIHAEWAAKDSIYLSDSIHTIKIDYFQGPRYELELQLYWHLGDSADRIFPGKDIVLYPPKPPSRWWIWLLIAIGIIALIIFLYRKTNKMKPTNLNSILIAGLLCSSLSLAACSGTASSEPSTPNSASATQASATQASSASSAGASFSATIDGTQFSSDKGTDNLNAAFSITADGQQRLFFMLADPDNPVRKLNFDIPDKEGPTTISILPKYSFEGYVTKDWVVYVDDGLTVNITSRSATRLSGTFSGNYRLENEKTPNNKVSLQVTDGKFDIPFSTSAQWKKMYHAN
jgi:hypothetical protein